MQQSWRDRLLKPLRQKLTNAVADAVEPMLRDLHERQLAELRAETRRIYDRVIEFEIRTRRDVVYAADRQASLDSAEFVRKHMQAAPRFADPHRTLEHALSLAPTGGLALEFGVAGGSTLKIIAAARETGVYGFDSFQGLPEAWRTDFPVGAFSVEGLPDVAGAELVVGWFSDTLPEFLERHPDEPVDFVHVDGDLYSSAKTVLDLVGPRLRPGSVLVFDEFFNFPGWQDHEYRAWQEYLDRTGTPVVYEGYSYNNEQVIVRIAEQA
jgi:predicted O-methyltransferase YrrM